MYIYGAQLQAKPGQGGQLAAALGELRDAASAAVGKPAWAWAVAAGAPVGSFALSSRMEGTGDLIDVQMSIAANAEYQKLAADLGDLLVGPAETSWVQVVGMAGDVGEPKAVTTVTTATVAGGQMAAAVGWANDMLEYASGITGLGMLLATSSAGSFFDLAFIAGTDSGAASDEATAALTADAGYIERIDQAADLFVDGTGNRVVMVQLP